MAIDYSIKGKGNDRKTVAVINQYGYDSRGRIIRTPWDSDLDSEIHDLKAADSDLQIQIWDNDSDIKYLTDVTVKYRGTIDPTQEGPYHKTVKPGDLYISLGEGVISNDSDWRNFKGEGVSKGDALLFTDSEMWYKLGSSVPVLPDSDTVLSIASLVHFKTSDVLNTSYQRNVRYGGIVNGSQSQSVFITLDSETTTILYSEFQPTGSAIMDGVYDGLAHFRISMVGGGPTVNGRLKIRNLTLDSDSTFDQLANNAAGVVSADKTSVDFFLINADIHAFAGRMKDTWHADHEYVMTYQDLTTNEFSQLYSLGGQGWRRWYPWEVAAYDLDSDLNRRFDSERHDWKAADSDIIKNIDSDIHWLKAYDSDFDSEVRRMFDSERHDRKAADSDILAFLDDRVVKYRNDSDINVRGIFFNNDSEGYLHWNPVDFTLDLHVNDEVTLQLGQEQTIFVRNESGTDMPNGTVVRLDGVSGSEFVVNFATNDSELGSHSTLGVTTQFIGNNNGGFVTFVGKVRDLDTQTPGWAVGDALWLGTDGNMTNVKPLSPAHLVFIGYVERVHPNAGIIYVKVQNGYELEEIHDVLITNYDSDGGNHSHNRVLMYDSDSKLWKNTRINVDYGVF